MEELKNPIHLLCPSCGAPTQYDISDEVYRCTHCGTTEQPGERVRRINDWRAVTHDRLRERFPDVRPVVYACPGCGAQVAVEKAEAVGRCAFCGGSLVRREYTEQDDFPNLVIPFRITEQQAKDALQSWARSHGDKREREAVEKNLQNLKGFYLPYEFVRGPVACTVSRDASHRTYECGGYVNEIAVNTSRQLKNEVLDAAEPFRWEEAQEFHFGYLAGQRVKMRDVADEGLEQRVREEVERDYLPVIEKTMQTRGLSVAMRSGELEELSILLPMYVIFQKHLSVAVNGQTGTVAVSLNETENRGRFWFVEPLLTTLVVLLAAWFFSKRIELTLMLSAVAGIIAFVAFGQDRKRHERLKVSSDNASGDKGGKRSAPVFRETVNGKTTDVEIRFYPPSRILGNALGMALFNALPLLIAAAIQLGRGLSIGELDFRYIGLWLVISVPFTFIFWIAWLRRDVFDHPVLYQKTAGGAQRIRIAGDTGQSVLGFVKDLSGLGGLLVLLVGLPLAMFVMSVVLMLQLV